MRRRPGSPITILFAFADHFEPEQKPGDPLNLQKERVQNWISGYEKNYSELHDSQGRNPQHTYFFPQEQYHTEILNLLSDHCDRGFGEIEIHIHHDNDTSEGFINKIENFKTQLRTHGVLPIDKTTGKTAYGFVHGNWALDNSRRDGRWCGLNDEISLLRDTGCYADFTLPCSPADGQTGIINSIYFADDDPERPKSHDKGRDVSFGGKETGDLLLIQGPLSLNWKKRKHCIFPRIENGDISITNPIRKDRIELWINAGVSVHGKENIVFVKVHTHGMKPRNTRMLLETEAMSGFTMIEKELNDGNNTILHYVTTREMANVVYALNDGIDSPVHELFDYRFILDQH